MPVCCCGTVRIDNKQSSHHQVDYFPTTGHPEVFYSSWRFFPTVCNCIIFLNITSCQLTLETPSKYWWITCYYRNAHQNERINISWTVARNYWRPANRLSISTALWYESIDFKPSLKTPALLFHHQKVQQLYNALYLSCFVFFFPLLTRSLVLYFSIGLRNDVCIAIFRAVLSSDPS